MSVTSKSDKKLVAIKRATALKRAVLSIHRRSGRSNYRLAVDAGVKSETIARLHSLGSEVKLETLLQICEALGLKVVIEARRK